MTDKPLNLGNYMTADTRTNSAPHVILEEGQLSKPGGERSLLTAAST
ncbi:hypothetical protein GFS60_07752 (plasmid) [Rhodococcus sp. WAY2]|nr:hypothetical protein GFS60_07752 [Rhodococcus sp. WAY2]